MAWTPLPEVVDFTVETPTPKGFTLDPKKTVVVVVDMQNVFCRTGNERSSDVVDGNAILLEKARASGAKVVYVQSLRQPDSPNYWMYNRRMYHIPGTWNAEIVATIKTEKGEIALRTYTHARDIVQVFHVRATEPAQRDARAGDRELDRLFHAVRRRSGKKDRLLDHGTLLVWPRGGGPMRLPARGGPGEPGRVETTARNEKRRDSTTPTSAIGSLVGS